jgi:hypothetical protein
MLDVYVAKLCGFRSTGKFYLNLEEYRFKIVRTPALRL